MRKIHRHVFDLLMDICSTTVIKTLKLMLDFDYLTFRSVRRHVFVFHLSILSLSLSLCVKLEKLNLLFVSVKYFDKNLGHAWFILFFLFS